MAIVIDHQSDIEVIDLGNVDFDDIEIKQELAHELERRITAAKSAVDPALAKFRAVSDAHQTKVIRDRTNTVRIIAPAGAGKTQTLVNRILECIKEGIPPDRLLLLTFDNAAANAIKAKLNETVEGFGGAIGKLTATTLNAFGYGVLRRHTPQEYKGLVEPAQAHSIIRHLKRALQEKSAARYALLPGKLKNRFYLEIFGLFKNQVFDPRSLDAQALTDFILKSPQTAVFFADCREPTQQRNLVQAIIWLYRQYDAALQNAQRIDFDDQKLRALAVLKGDAQLGAMVAGQYSEVIVDEFQDINRLDFELIQLVASKARLVVTGDDDQSLYGFRGCTPEFIINFEHHAQRVVTSHELRVNYRCPKNIVEHATQLIRHNTRRLEKNPVAHRQDVASIKVVSAGSAYIEARSICALIRKIKKTKPSLGFEDFAVLYRTNAQSLPIQVEFILNDVPYYVREQDNILEQNTLGRLLAILRVKIACAKAQAAESADAAEAVLAYFQYAPDGLRGALEHYFSAGEPFIQSLKSARFKKLHEKLASSNVDQHLVEVVRLPRLVDTLTYIGQHFHGVQGMIGSLEEVVEGGVPLGEVFELAAAFKGNIENFVTHLESALQRAREVGAGRRQDDGVALLTYFKAKGLQWHTVILPSCNDGLIPHRNAHIEDERRLFYVAMTRASSNLVVSYLKKSCGTKVAISPFVAQAGLLPR